jgi:hypothetical protein
MFIGILYNKTIKAYDMSQIERLASRIANKHDNRIDEMIVDYEDDEGKIFIPARSKYVRIDKRKWKFNGYITEGGM